jgi:hypothetical protein
MTPPLKILLSVLSVPLLILVYRLTYHETRVPHDQAEVFNRMIELEKEGRYDKAVEVAQNWMSDGGQNVAHNGVMYDQIAMVYILKAYKRPGTREESVRRAEDNLEKALSYFDSQNRDELSLELFEIGGGFEALGDLSDKDKCRFYEKARMTFVRQLPMINGDSYTAYGKTIRLEPVRSDVRKHLNAVNDKSVKAGCPISLEK